MISVYHLWAPCTDPLCSTKIWINKKCNAWNLDTPCNPFTAAPWWSTVELSLLIVQAVLWSCYGLQLGFGIQSRVQQKGDERRHRCRPEPKQTSTKSTNNPCNVSGLNLGQWNIIIYPECIIPPFQRRTMRVEHGWATSHSCAVRWEHGLQQHFLCQTLSFTLCGGWNCTLQWGFDHHGHFHAGPHQPRHRGTHSHWEWPCSGIQKGRLVVGPYKVAN